MVVARGGKTGLLDLCGILGFCEASLGRGGWCVS